MNRIPPLYRSLPLTIATSITLLPAIGLAETASKPRSETLEEVLVVDRKRAYRGDFSLLETPATDLIIPEDILQNSGALNLNDALDLSSSVARQNNFGGLWNSFAVRGFIGDANLPSNYLINGFNAGRGFGGPKDLAGIESVEVLKGPRAALYGRGEPGGTVNLISKRPYATTEGDLQVSAGRYDDYRTDVDWNHAVSDRLGYRLVGFAEESESFRDTIESSKQGFYPSVAWQLSDASTLIYELEYSRSKVPFDRGVVSVDGDLGVIPDSRFLGEPGDGDIEASVTGHQLEWQYDISPDWSFLAGANYRNSQIKGYSTEPELSSSRQLLLEDGRTLTRQRRYRDYTADHWMLRAEFSGNLDIAGLQHRIIIGVDTDRFENDQIQLRARAPSLSSNPSLEELQAIDIFEPVYGNYSLPTPDPLTDRVEVQESNAIYFQDQISLTDQLDLRLGARYDRFEQKMNNRASSTRSEQDDERVSPQLGIVYKFSPTLSAYGVYGEGFRALSGADFNGNTFDPNTSKSTELGVKWISDERELAANVSVFYIEQKNILSSDPVNSGYLIASGEARSRGVEVDVFGEPVDNINVWLSYSYTDAYTVNDLLDPDFGLLVESGDRLLNVPEHAASVQLSGDYQLAGLPLRSGATINYVGERLGETGTDFELPSYTLTSLFTEVTLSDAISLSAHIDNLFDKTYYPNSYSSLWVQPGTPLTYRISAKVSF